MMSVKIIIYLFIFILSITITKLYNILNIDKLQSRKKLGNTTGWIK